MKKFKITNELINPNPDNSARVWDIQDPKKIKQLKVFKNFSNVVNDVAIYDKGKKASFACADTSLVHYDLETLEFRDKNWLHKDEAYCLAASPDENTLYSGSMDRRILIIDGEKMEFKDELGKHEQGVYSLLITPDNERLVSGSKDLTVKVWDLKLKKIICVLKGHQGIIKALAVNSSGTKLFSGDWDNKIKVWDFKNYKQMVTFNSGGNIMEMAVSSDSMRLFSAQYNKAIRQWELSDSKFIDFNQGHYASILRMDISPDGKYLYTVGYDMQVIIWNLQTKKEKRKLKGHNWTIHGVCVSSDGSKLVTCTFNSRLRLWDLKKEIEIWTVSEVPSMKFVLFSHDDREIVTACCDSLIRVHDVKTGKELRKFEDGHSSNVFRVILTNDNKTLISSSSDRTAIIWDYRSCEKLRVLEGHSKEVEALALITLKGRLKVVTGSFDCTMRVWDLETGASEFEKDYGGKICDIVATDDNKRLIVGCSNKVFVLDIAGAFAELQAFDNEKFEIIDIMVTRDSKKLFIAGGKFVDIYAEQQGKYQREDTLTEGFSGKIVQELISPDMQMLIYADGENSIHIWDFHGHRIAKSYSPHKKAITGLIMTEDNKVILSASLDGKIVVYGLEEREVLKEYKAHPSGVTAMELCKTIGKLISAGEDAKIRVWSYPSMEKLEELETNDDILNSIVILNTPELQFLTGGSKKRIAIWDLSVEAKRTLKTSWVLANLPETVKKLVITPDNNILLIYLANSTMQIWDTVNFSYIHQLPLDNGNYRTIPVFLSKVSSRLMLYFNRIIDTTNGEVIFNIDTNRTMKSFFFDLQSNSFYYIDSYSELYKLDLSWLQSCFFEYMKYDALTSLNKEPESFIKRTSSTYPFFFSFLHLVVIFDMPELFIVELLEAVYLGKVEIAHFFTLDIFRNTPLDIILMKKNITLMNKFFNLLFFYFAKENASFFQKVRFMNYRFREGYDMLDLMFHMIELCAPDLSIISKLLEFSTIPFDTSLYDDSLNFRELRKPIHVWTESIYSVDKEFIESSLTEVFQNIDRREGNTETTVKQNKSLVRAKLVSIPGICDINNDKTERVFSALADCEPNNDIFANKILQMLADYIWFRQIKSIFVVDFVVFFIFFALFNFSFIIIYPLRVDIYYSDDSVLPWLNVASVIIDLMLIVYGLYMLINEVRQFCESGFIDYFKSIWNYFDILLIPSLLLTCVLDIERIRNSGEIDAGLKTIIKLLSAFAMFCFWFRFLSFSRAVNEMASMIRLIFTVISRTKYFVIFMILFILTLSATFYLMHNDNIDENPSFWDVVLVFFNSTNGDTSGITDYDLVEPDLKDYFLIFSSFLFAIILLNLLVSIIGDIHGEIKESGEKTRLYELINILVDTNFSNTAKIIRFFSGFASQQKTNYLVQLLNEKHEEKEVDVYEDLEKKLGDRVREIVVTENTRIIQSEFEKIRLFLEKNKAK